MEENKEEIIEKEEATELEEKSKAITLKDGAIRRLKLSFNKHLEAKEYKLSNNLAYWLKTFANYHDAEKTFDLTKIKTYSRGDIIKANLGFNVGNELGGLHYCLVLNKNDNHSFGTLNVIPLTSIKENKSYPKHSVNLGDELYQLLIKKYVKITLEVKPQIEEALKDFNSSKGTAANLKILSSRLDYLEKIEKEIESMKHGSIVLINQITTISKQRIYDPINNNGILSKIKLSSDSLTKIDDEIKKMLTK